MRGAAHIERPVRSEDQRVAHLLLLADVGHLLVVELCPAVHCLHHRWIAPHPPLDERQQSLGRFSVAGFTGEYHHIPVASLALHPAQRNAVAHATVEQALAVDDNRLRHHGHRGRCPDPFQRAVGVVLRQASVIDRLPGVDIGAGNVELHGVGMEGLEVEWVVLGGHRVVTEPGVIVVARGQQRPQAGIAAVVGKPLVVAQCASGLVRLEVASESRPCRHPHQRIDSEPVLHHHIEQSAGEHAAHATAFKYESAFHGLPVMRV